MDIIVKAGLFGFFFGILVLAATYGAYQAFKDKMDKTVDKLEDENLKLAAEIDKANMKVRRYQIEIDDMRKAHFAERAEDVFESLKKEKNLSSGN
jgi:hypothetical protein